MLVFERPVTAFTSGRRMKTTSSTAVDEALKSTSRVSEAGSFFVADPTIDVLFPAPVNRIRMLSDTDGYSRRQRLPIHLLARRGRARDLRMHRDWVVCGSSSGGHKSTR